MFYFNIFPDKLPIDTKKSQSHPFRISGYNDIKEKVCDSGSVRNTQKEVFAMRKRKITTVEAFFILLFFTCILLLVPRDANAQAQNITKENASYSIAASYAPAAKASATRKTVAAFRSSKTTLWVGHKVTMRSLISLKGGTSLTIKNAKSSKPSVLAVSGNYLVPKKAGTAVVTAKLNGVNRRITITVSKLAAKPTIKNLKTSVAGIKYGPNNMKTYYTLKFTNTSAKTITTAKIRITTGSGIYDQMYWTKTLTLNLKPGKTMTKTYFIQNMVQAPEKSDISIKCLKLSWK